MNLVIFGPPGAGKGTQSKFISNKFNLFEILTYSTLAIVILIFGIKPNLILDYTSSSLERIIKLYPISIF